MLMALLVILGVPLWLVLGWLAGVLWHRHETNQLPDVFKTKVRTVSGTYRHTGEDFPRIAGRAIWAHDILILEKGVMIPRTLHFKVADSVQPPQPADAEQVKGLGDSPVTMQYRLDDGGVIEIAAPGEASALAQGPFFSDTTQ